jgi:hypothetical protein
VKIVSASCTTVTKLIVSANYTTVTKLIGPRGSANHPAVFFMIFKVLSVVVPHIMSSTFFPIRYSLIILPLYADTLYGVAAFYVRHVWLKRGQG